MSTPPIVFTPQPAAAPAQTQTIAGSLQFTVSGAENIRLVIFNSQPNVRVMIAGRRQLPDATIQPFSYEFVPSSDRMQSAVILPLGEGTVLNVVVFASAGNPVIGQTYVRVQLVQGLDGAITLVGTILAGYITASQDVAWPGSTITSSLEGGGYVRHIIGTTPAAGGEVSETVPQGARWQLVTFKCFFLPTGAGPARRVFLSLTAGGTAFIYVVCPRDVTDGEVVEWQWAQGMPLPTAYDSTFPMAGLPRLSPLLPGNRIATFTESLQLTDAYLSVDYTVLEYLEAQ